MTIRYLSEPKNENAIIYIATVTLFMPDTSPERTISQSQRDALTAAFDACTCFRFRRASRLVTQLFDNHLKGTGLRATQLVLLAALAEKDGLAHNELADRIGVSASALTRALKPLVKKEFVEVRAQDGRRNAMSLTAAGAEVALQAAPSWQIAQDEMAQLVAPFPLSDLLTILDRFSDSAQKR